MLSGDFSHGVLTDLTMIRRTFVISHCDSFVIRHSGFVNSPHARTGTLAVRSSLPQLTHAPLIARRIAFQMQ
jgi:hypothetical protein